ncbi:hypothetical protein ACFWMQ_25845 [Streptomyces sp. NPDC058372]|uniref:hypothetical protein n=1 Tax=Streptomyces sp. NPDC058372 TaxID=3346464 RepID=UPI003667C03A
MTSTNQKRPGAERGAGTTGGCLSAVLGAAAGLGSWAVAEAGTAVLAPGGPADTLRSDGVHLSPAGGAVAHRAVLAALTGPTGGPGPR